MKIAVGTSGFSYPAWKGTFYPEKLSNTKMLGFYAGKFPTVEINNTFYRMPSKDALAKWSAEVGPDFRFAIKAPKQITHIKRLVEAESALEYLCATTEVLGEKRGPLLFQLPPFMKKDLERLANFLSKLPTTVRATFEFRHSSWFDDEVFALLEKSGVALCVAEDEKLATPLRATAGFGYLRLRRQDYVESDVARWIEWIRAQKWSEAFVYFKHEDEARGPEFANVFTRLWG